MKKPRIGLVTRREMKGYVFLLPWLIGFVAFFAVPLCQSIYYSFCEIIATKGSEKVFVGWANYRYIFEADVEFTGLLGNFFSDAVLRLAVILVFALVIAMMLNQPIRCKGVFRTLFFLPIIVVSGPVLENLISDGTTTVSMIEGYGVVAIIESMLPPMLARPLSSLFEQLILVLWYSGVPILIYMTGLQKIDGNLYEAAMIDGANGWISFWKITLPALRPMILINGVYTMVFLATTGINEVIAYINNKMFADIATGGYGKASAMAWLYCLGLGLVLAVLFLVTRERKPKKVEVTITAEQRRIERMHQERARNMRSRKGGKRLGK